VTSDACSRCTSTRSSPRACSGTSTASTSGASSWARKWTRKSYLEAGNGPGNVHVEHPQVPEDGGRELAARDRAGGPEIRGEAGGHRCLSGEGHAGDPVTGPEGAVRRRDTPKMRA